MLGSFSHIRILRLLLFSHACLCVASFDGYEGGASRKGCASLFPNGFCLHAGCLLQAQSERPFQVSTPLSFVKSCAFVASMTA